MNRILITLLIVGSNHLIQSIDEFCGQLEIFNERRFGLGAITVSSQVTNDLKECLDVCCSIAECHGVTFEGITNPNFDDANCLLVTCDQLCHLNAQNKHSAGVLSVLLHRDKNETISESVDEVGEEVKKKTDKSKPSISRKASVQSAFWVLALAIGVASVCVGLNVTLCLAYCCYCRRKRRSQKAHISSVIGGPTLHAYNPPI